MIYDAMLDFAARTETTRRLAMQSPLQPVTVLPCLLRPRGTWPMIPKKLWEWPIFPLDFDGRRLMARTKAQV